MVKSASRSVNSMSIDEKEGGKRVRSGRCWQCGTSTPVWWVDWEKKESPTTGSEWLEGTFRDCWIWCCSDPPSKTRVLVDFQVAASRRFGLVTSGVEWRHSRVLSYWLVRALDPFTTGKNGARYSLWSSIDSSFQEESIGTHIDHDFKIFGLDLASFPPYASECVKLAKFRCFRQFLGNF